MRTLPFLAIALLAAAGPTFAAAPAPADAPNVVILSAASDAAGWRAVHDVLARAGYTVVTDDARAAAADERADDIDYPSQLGPEGPRALAGASR